MPPQVTGMSGADTAKLKELSEKVPELSKSLKSVLERLEKAEDKLEEKDFVISEISKSLSNKADKSDLVDNQGLEDTVNDILRQLKQFDVLRNDIETLRKRSDALEKTTVSLENKIDFMNNTINERLRDLENILEALKEELEKLDTESNRQGGLIIQISQRIDTLEIKIDNQDKIMSGSMLGGDIGNSTNNYEVGEVKKALGNLRRDFLSFKEDYYKRDKEFETELEKKVDKVDLVEFERVMRDRMEGSEKQLQKTKGELKKAMRILDDRIKRVGDQVNSRGPSLERDDALFARKPLEGYKCASCEKDLVNMIGMPAEYHTWNKMPKKEGERIPMMGQGFSRMLMTLNHHNSVSAIEEQNTKTMYSPKVKDSEVDSLQNSRNEKFRNSTSRLEKDGSTTVNESVLPQIRKSKKKILK